jgi:hypothetical protein
MIGDGHFCEREDPVTQALAGKVASVIPLLRIRFRVSDVRVEGIEQRTGILNQHIGKTLDIPASQTKFDPI